MIFYRPKNAWLGDVMPFYEKGEFKIFYLHDTRKWGEQVRGGHWGPISCYLLSTKDLLNFKEDGEVLPRGSKMDQDYYVFTGSIIKSKSEYHFFYCGHNPYFQKNERPGQAIMHAKSKNILKWEKIAEDTFYPDNNIFELHDWRDPYVFWNSEMKEFWMLLTARKKEGPVYTRGCIILYISNDLAKWSFSKIFWEPKLYINLEVPELFKMGKFWYLIYSTYSERWVTHYRISDSVEGPWSVPFRDTFDGRAFYAAKTVSDGNKRYVIGWIPTRYGDKDYSKWEWGGNLIVHEIMQDSDGTLSVKVPYSLDSYFKKGIQFKDTTKFGDSVIKKNNSISIQAKDSFEFILGQNTPSICKISGKISFEKNTKGVGVILRASDDLEKCYFIRIEPDRDRIVLDSWPREGDVPFMVELERPINLDKNMYHEFKIFIDNTICVIYLDNKVAMSSRLYNHSSGRIGVFVKEGIAEFRDITIWTKE